ncbi:MULTISPECIES: phosphopantetheine-binding protein [unclassified Streptomyces]|uniref:acyl carrier protein n=1 Tax=unclassified Streptomyces TaxID=2593676 RepID=UPI00343F1B25
MQEISYRFLSELVSYHFDIDADRLRPDTTFDDLGMDSLALMELVVVLENETGIVIPDDLVEIGPNATLREIADVVKRISDGITIAGAPGPARETTLPDGTRDDRLEGARID